MRGGSRPGYHAIVEPGSDDELTRAVARARCGLRTEVARLLDALSRNRLLLPLARRLPEVPVGIDVEIGGSLSLHPHVLEDGAGRGWLPMFTEHARAGRVAADLAWTTGGGPLELCALPGPAALEVALEAVDGERIVGVVLNPGDGASELSLDRDEIASLAQRRPVPLVGYVGRVDGGPGGRLVAEADGPADAALVSAIEAVLAELRPAPRFTLHRTFDPERDREPHLTLNVLAEEPTALDWPALAARLGAAVEGRLPAPGYVDIVLNDPLLC